MVQDFNYVSFLGGGGGRGKPKGAPDGIKEA